MDINYLLLSLMVVLLAMAGAAFLSCSRVTEPGLSEAEKQPGPPALVIAQDAPLLLDEPDRAEKPLPGIATKVLADNGPCFVCHANYQAEPLASGHAAANIGCVACHGPSYAHRNDENNTTPPDIMYPPDSIDPACHKCHAPRLLVEDKSGGLAPAFRRGYPGRWPGLTPLRQQGQRCPNKTDARRIVCTDCHGEHRLKVRTVQWDRKTGKLLR